jgi:hypothetical protein
MLYVRKDRIRDQGWHRDIPGISIQRNIGKVAILVEYGTPIPDAVTLILIEVTGRR